MIWSVSTSRAVERHGPGDDLAYGFHRHRLLGSVQVVGGGEVAGDRGGGGDRGRHEVRAPALALAALEVAVRRATRTARPPRACRGSSPGTSSTRPRASRTRRRGTPRRAPRPRPAAFTAHRTRARRACACRRLHRAGPAATAAAARRSSMRRVGARADEHGVDGDVADRRAGLSGPCTRARAARRRASSPSNESGLGTTSSIVTDCAGLVPHVTVGRSVAASSTTSVSNVAPSSVTSERQSSSACSHAAPFGAKLAALEVGERRVVGRDHPGARARLDRHVAHGHAAFHRQRADRRPAVLDDRADPAAGADAADDREHDVLRGDARGQRRRRR